MLEKYDDIEEFADLLQSIRDYFKLRDDAFRKGSIPDSFCDCMSDEPADCMSNPSILEP